MGTPTESEWKEIKGVWADSEIGVSPTGGDDGGAAGSVDDAAVPDEPSVEEQEEDVGRGETPDDGEEDPDPEPTQSGGGDGEVIVEVDEGAAQRHRRQTKATIEEMQEAQGDEQAMRQIDKTLTLDKALDIHLTDRDKDEVHAILAEQIDSNPENFWDHSQESDRDDWDQYYYWDLKRDDLDETWYPANIDLQEFITDIESRTQDGVLLETEVYEME